MSARMSMKTRRTLLGISVLLLFGAVIADRTGVLDKLRNSESASTRGEALAGQSSLLARQQALVDAQPAWAAAEAQAERAWADLRSSVLRAETRALAEADLRERLRSALRLPGIVAPEATSVARPATPQAAGERGQPAASAGVRVERLRFRVAFDAAEHAHMVDAIDRIAGLASPRVRVESLSIVGPGEKTEAVSRLTVTMEIEAVAVIGAVSDPSLAMGSRQGGQP